jgi:phage baseplate assembly protein W
VSGAEKPTGAAGVRFLNPATRDYEHDTVSGQLKQMPSVRQRVLIALTTTIESSTVQREFGLRRPRKIDGQFLVRMKQAIREALRQMTDVEKVMRVERIDVERGVSGSATARVQTTVVFVDLTTGKEDAVRA